MSGWRRGSRTGGLTTTGASRSCSRQLVEDVGRRQGLDNAAWDRLRTRRSRTTTRPCATPRATPSTAGAMTLTKFGLPDWRPGMDAACGGASAQHRFPVWWTGDGVNLRRACSRWSTRRPRRFAAAAARLRRRLPPTEWRRSAAADGTLRLRHGAPLPRQQSQAMVVRRAASKTWSSRPRDVVQLLPSLIAGAAPRPPPRAFRSSHAGPLLARPPGGGVERPVPLAERHAGRSSLRLEPRMRRRATCGSRPAWGRHVEWVGGDGPRHFSVASP